MKFFITLLAITFIIGPAFAKVEPSVESGDGFVNINDRLERTHEVYPGIVLWYEFGRPFWKAAGTATTMDQPKLKREMKVTKLNNDYDKDGVKNKLDQCANTKAGTTVNAFGCASGADIKIDLGVKFASGKATLNTNYTKQLDKLGMTMKEHKDLKVAILGHTDNTGSRKYNLWISNERSKAVKAYLMNSHGIESNRLVAKGHGPDLPKVANNTAEGRRENRRVEGSIITD